MTSSTNSRIDEIPAGYPIFLWYITGDSRLPAAILPKIRNPANQVYLSVISVWEIIVKHQIGKLAIPKPPETYLLLQRQLHGIESLPLDEMSVIPLVKLPMLHRDPFDRMLLCQAVQQNLTLVSVDPAVRGYSGHVAIVP